MRSGRQLQFDRLVFFSDAVFAIAITLLVIDIRLPHIEVTREVQLQQALADQISHYAGFVVSFLVIGRFWSGHHRLFGYLKDWDAGLVSKNLRFLMAIAFMPFPTAVVAQYGGARTAVIFYAGWLILAGLLNRELIRHINGHPELLAEPLSEDERRDLLASWLPIAIGGLAIAGALIRPVYGLGMLVFSPVVLAPAYWWLARRRIRHPPSAAAAP